MKFIPLYLLVLIGFTVCNVLACRGDRENGNQLSSINVPSARFKLDSVDDLYSFLDPENNEYPLVSAHRGGPAPGYPENAIPTFERVANAMPVIIECDIAITRDSVLVLMHDDSLDRTTNGTGKIKDKTLDELRKLRLKDLQGRLTEFSIPTLEETLLWGRKKVIFTLDVKRSVPYKKVIDMIRKTEAEPYAIVITYSAKQTAIVNQLAPDLVISATIKDASDLSRLIGLGIPTNRLIAFVGTREPNTSLYDGLVKKGIKSILGTLGNLDRAAEKAGYQRYAQYIDRGASILSTDRPFEAQKALDYYIQSRDIRSKFLVTASQTDSKSNQ